MSFLAWLMGVLEFRCVGLEDEDDYPLGPRAFEFGLNYPDENEREEVSLLLRPFGGNENFHDLCLEGDLFRWRVNSPNPEVRDCDGVLSQSIGDQHDRRYGNTIESYTLTKEDTRKKIMGL